MGRSWLAEGWGARRWPVISGFVVLSLFSAATHASLRDRVLPELQHTVWLGKDGAPSDVTSLAQTEDGLLWLGTEYGLIRFDGLRFSYADDDTGLRYPTVAVRSLYAPRDGGLWIGFSSGHAVVFLKNGKAVTYQTTDAMSLGTVYAFAEEDDRTLWIATLSGGLCRLRAGEKALRCGNVDGFPAEHATALLVGRDGTVWAATEHALYTRRRGSNRFAKALDGFGFLYQIKQAPDGRVWMADARGSVRVAGLDEHGVLALQAGIAVQSADLSFDADGDLWITTLGAGLRRLRFPGHLSSGLMPDGDLELEHFAHEDGLSGNYAWPVLVGREGEVWIGTSAGVDRFQEQSLVPANFPPGAHDFALAAGEDGSVWAGTTNHPLMLLRGRDVHEFAEVPPEVNYIHRDDEGTIWIGTDSAVYRVQNGQPRRIAPLPVQARTEQVRSIVVDRARTLWIVLSLTGVYKWQHERWTHQLPPAQIAQPAAVLAQTLDNRGRLWRSYTNGFIVISDGDRTRVYGTQDGLNIGDAHSFYRGRRFMWIGASKGLAIFDGDRFRTLASSVPGELDGISGIVEMDSGDLWLRSVAGLLHYNAEAVRAAIKGGPLRGERFDHLDGLPGQSAQRSPLPTLIKGTDGRLWLATGSGVVWVNPAHLVRDTFPTSVRIESLDSGGRHLSLSGEVLLPAGLNRVQIRYTAAALRMPERTQFRYRLDGVDLDWQDAGTRREALYTNLSPGRYAFHVIASNSDGTWNMAGSSIQIRIAPTFYQTRWFYALCGVALMGLLAMWHRVRMRRMQARTVRLLEARFTERERIARELHDTVLQGLASASLQLEVADRQIAADAAAKPLVQRVSQLLHQLMDEGRHTVRGLRLRHPEAGNLERALTQISKDLATPRNVKYQVVVEGTPRSLRPLVREEIYRIAGEALANAFRHAHASTVETVLEYGQDHFRLLVRDDGQGIHPEILKAGREGHFGLSGLRERASKIGARLKVSTAAGAGTEVDLLVPAVAAFEQPAPRGPMFWIAKLYSRSSGP
jgi:signal transduction histidine kinase/ligand-binding sensor domain-containing protein